MTAERHDKRLPGAAAPRRLRLLLMAALSSVCAACAAGSRDPAAGRPSAADAPPRPIVLGASDERRDRAVNNWLALTRAQSPAAAPAPELQPVTATIRALPPSAPDALRLPLVEIGGAGEGEADADEATRESLRRFIAGARDLLGVDPQNLSLHEFRDEGGGVRVARYLQKPFPRPLRNGYGVVEIRFDASRRVLSLSSTAIPDTERLAQELAALRPNRIPSSQLASRLAGRSFNYQSGGADATFTVGPGTVVDVRDLVVYPILRATDPAALEMRLAWETVVGRDGTNLLVYADSVTGEVISAVPTTEAARPAPASTPAPPPASAPTPRPAATAQPTPVATDAPAPSPTPTPAATARPPSPA